MSEISEEEFYTEAAGVFFEVFKFRTDTFAQQVPDGYIRIKRALTIQDIIEHLQGKNSFGAFPIFPEDNSCYFGVIDLDEMDFSIVEQLRKNANSLGIDDSRIPYRKIRKEGFPFLVYFSG